MQYKERKTLTGAFCRNVKKPGKFHDTNGLHLVVRISRRKGWLSKSWVWRGTVAGRRVDVGLCPFPEIGLQAARDAAFQNRKLAKQGIDPRGSIARVRSDKPVFSEAVEAVIEIQRSSWRGTGTESEWRSSFTNHAAPVMQKTVDAISTSDVLRVMRPLWSDKPETGRRLLNRISAVFQWCQVQGHRIDNPTQAVGRVLPKQNGHEDRRHPSLPYGQINDLLTTVRDKRGENDTGVLALTFIILTAARSGEALNATWDEFDLDQRLWVVPNSRMKSGRPHRVPLSSEALTVLEQCKALHPDSPFLFPSPVKRDAPISGQHLRRTLSLANDSVTVHGFRSAFRDWCAESGQPRDLAERSLAHIVGGTEGAYYRSDLLQQRRKMMQQWADEIT